MHAALLLLYLVILVVGLAATWKMFTKAGVPGWGALIPIYSTYLLCKIAGRPWWWLLLMLIPIVGIVVLIVIWNDISKAFGHGAAFTAGLFLLSFIFIPILGFGSSQYRGPATTSAY